MDQQQLLARHLRKFLKKPDYGRIGNDTLYQLCRRYPNHKNEAQIVGKVWLIGRSYAVSLERNKKRKRKISDDFYNKDVAQGFKKGFDELLRDLKGKELTEKNIPNILKVHKEAVDFVHRVITKDARRSFVSKYLHFHFPNLFFIYDSRAASVINNIIRRTKGDPRSLSRKFKEDAKYSYDEAYALFFNKCFYLKIFCENNRIRADSEPVTRMIDRFLIEEANAKHR